MLSWFKKKFGKKETDQQPSEADLKIPVAPRPDVAAVKETADIDAVAQPPATGEPETTAAPAEPEWCADTAIEPAADDEDQTAPPPSPEPAAAPQEMLTGAAITPAEETEPPPDQQPIASGEDMFEPQEQETAGAPDATVAPDAAAIEVQEEEPAAAQDQIDQPQPAAARSERPEDLPGQPGAQPDRTVEPKPAAKKKSFLSRLSERLSRTRESFTYQLDTLFLGRKEIDGKLLDDLEELLITADLGMKVTTEVLDHARRKVKRKELSDPQSLKLVLKAKLRSFIEEHQQDASLVMPEEGPFVIMVVGVNGVGKTTTIGKIAHKFLRSGQSVLLVAADTFRAAAVSQLKIWGERNQVPVIAKEEGADPSAVVYDGIAHARAKGYDVVLVDTAGRLHTQSKLMEELKKIKRVMGKQLEGAPHEVMLVIDATTGQNGISQAKLFNEAVTLTGITLTKLDGTAKGGIVINIGRELQLPIRFIGVGEQLDDLRDFDPDEFIDALFQSGDQARA